MKIRMIGGVVAAVVVSLGALAHGQTPASNAIPSQETFEARAAGESIIVPGFTNGWYGDTNSMTAVVSNFVYGVPGQNYFFSTISMTNVYYPVASATHTNVLAFTDAAMTNQFATYDTSVAGTNMTVDFMIKPVLREEGAAAASLTNQVAGCQTAMYVDSNGFLNVWHGITSLGDDNAWMTFTNAPPLGTSDWARITVAFDYTTDAGGSPYFAVMMNGSTLVPTNASGYIKYEGYFEQGAGGIWLHSANPAPKQVHSFAISGSGMLDDFVVTTNTVSQFFPVPASSRTLTVISAHGGALPGTIATNDGAVVYEAIDNSPVVNGSTQYVCLSGTVVSNAFNQVNPTNITVSSLTNDATLTWNWQTQYQLATAASGNGSVDVATGFHPSGAVVVITATSLTNAHFVSWSGDTNGAIIEGAVITVTMGQPLSVTANFAIDVTSCTLTVNSAHGGALPGSLTTNSGVFVTQVITSSPVVDNLTTQYVCQGGSVAGNDYTLNAATNITLTLTNNAALTWIWQTQYQLTTATNGNGAVDVVSGFQPDGTNVAITATALTNSHFVSWSGETNGWTLTGNVITGVMTQARSITANFALDTFTLVGVAQGNGTVVQTNATVVYGGSTNFTVTASNYYRILGLSIITAYGTNIVDVPFDNTSTNYSFVWTNVQADGELDAHFIAQVVTNAPGNTPYWWLAQYGLNNYAVDAAADPDNDGLVTWQEYVAGTVPTNSVSVLKVLNVTSDGNIQTVRWLSSTGALYNYSLYYSTNLSALNNGWTASSNNLVPNPAARTNSVTITPPGLPVFYKITVESNPPG